MEVVHNILLNIAKVFAEICDKHHIPYYMLGGTMLGAIRHKGFIPWDDDMDFGVPRPYYKTLIDCLEKELPYPYRCCTYKNNPGVYAAILKIDDCRTLVDDPTVPLSLDKQIGVNIDVFPLDYCSENDKNIIIIYKLGLLYQTVYVFNRQGKKWKNLIKRLLSSFFPVSRIRLLDLMHRQLSKVKSGPMLANVFGAWKEKEWVPIEWYGENEKYIFEDTEFCGIKDYNAYLTKMYGDYMTPPKGDLHLHINNVYWRDLL